MHSVLWFKKKRGSDSLIPIARNIREPLDLHKRKVCTPRTTGLPMSSLASDQYPFLAARHNNEEERRLSQRAALRRFTTEDMKHAVNQMSCSHLKHYWGQQPGCVCGVAMAGRRLQGTGWELWVTTSFRIGLQRVYVSTSISKARN